MEQPPPANADSAAISGAGRPAPAEPAIENTLLSLQQDVETYRDQALRKAAEFDNYRKRMVREKEENLRYANSALIESLLPVLDSFERGLESARTAEGAQAIVRGFEMVEKQLHEFLRENGVEKIDARDQPFDPNVHEAVAQQHDPNVAEGHVLNQIRNGYRLRDRLLRPASVVVSKGPAAE